MVTVANTVGYCAGGVVAGGQNIAMTSLPGPSFNSHRRRSKQEVCDAFVSRLSERGDIDCNAPGFLESIQQHFDRLPSRYAIDVNTDTLDVLSHKRLLDEARLDPAAVSFAVRPVDVVFPKHQPVNIDVLHSPSFEPAGGRSGRRATFARPAFGSSPNLQALALEAGEKHEPHDDGSVSPEMERKTFYEITIASVDQPKLLSRLSEALGDLNLNIHEAHAFNTSDGFSLDVFVVDGWTQELAGETLEELLGQRLLRMPSPAPSVPRSKTNSLAAAEGVAMRLPEESAAPMSVDQAWQRRAGTPPPDDWEIDISQLQIDAKVASGSFSNLYKGSYCGQEVAIKILKDVADDTTQYQEFLQEVSIMRKVRHKNVVQFIGACTRKPNLCIVFEYMSGGSLYDYVRREGQLRHVQVVRIALEVSKGMDYLHQRKIIHRDLKAANLLLDENQIVKIADFGVARVIECNGHMTAETGTYRWMAPEVIEHRPYDEKADVFSFGVVIWELLTCKVPYNDMTPLQAAVGVVQKGLRPGMPPNTPPALAEIMQACWDASPAHRPTFKELTPRLQHLYEQLKAEDVRKTAAAAKASGGGLLSKLRGK